MALLDTESSAHEPAAARPSTASAWLTLVVMGVVAWWTWGPSLGGSPSVRGVAPDVILDAATIIEAYASNELAADAAYGGHVIGVRGVVDTVGKDILGHAYVTVRGDESSVRHAQCMLADEASVSSARLLRPGEPVFVKGRPKTGLLGPLLDDCVIPY